MPLSGESEFRMPQDPPERKPNPVIQKIEASKTVRTNDQPRNKPTYERAHPGIGPGGSVGTEKTQRQKEADAHNARIKARQKAIQDREKARTEPVGLAAEFNRKL